MINKLILMFVVNFVKSLLKSYFADIIEQFKLYLVFYLEVGGLLEEDMRKLQIQILGIDKDIFICILNYI